MMNIITEKGIESIKPFKNIPERPCIFERIYLASPDSIVGNKTVYTYRKSLGFELAKENDISADVVVPVPDSGVSAALGFSQKSSIPFELGIIRSHYVGRTFIEPSQTIRQFGVKLKHSVNKSLFGDIHKYMRFGTPFRNKNRFKHLPFIKVWSGR